MRSISRLKKFIEGEYITRSLRVNHKENVYSGSCPPSKGLFYILLQIAPQLAFTPSRKPHEVCPGGTPSFLSRELQSKKAYCDRSSLLYTPLYQCCRESQSIADYYRTSRGLHQVITPYYKCGKDQKILEYALM